MFFLVTHLPGVIELCGLPSSVSGAALSLLGLFNIAGSIGAGLGVQSHVPGLEGMLAHLRSGGAPGSRTAPKARRPRGRR